MSLDLQNQPPLQVEFIEPGSTRDVAAFSDVMGQIVPTGTPGMTSLIQGGALNAFPKAAYGLFADWWANCPCGPGERPCLPLIGEVVSWDYVQDVDAPPVGYAASQERGDRLYVWDNTNFYFLTWFGRWFQEPNINWEIDGPTPHENAIPLAIPTGSLFNGAYWTAGDVVNPEGTLNLPPDDGSVYSCYSAPAGNGGENAGSDLTSSPAKITTTTVVAGLLLFFLFSRRKK